MLARTQCVADSDIKNTCFLLEHFRLVDQNHADNSSHNLYGISGTKQEQPNKAFEIWWRKQRHLS